MPSERKSKQRKKIIVTHTESQQSSRRKTTFQNIHSECKFVRTKIKRSRIARKVCTHTYIHTTRKCAYAFVYGCMLYLSLTVGKQAVNKQQHTKKKKKIESFPISSLSRFAFGAKSTPKAHRSHPHIERKVRLDSSVEEKGNPLSPHQKFKHFNTELELHILQ